MSGTGFGFVSAQVFTFVCLLQIIVGQGCGDSFQCTELLLLLWKYGCNTWNWGEYGAKVSSIWSRSSSDWTRHYTEDSRLFFVILIAYIKLGNFLIYCCVFVDVSFKIEFWFLVKGETKETVIVIILLVGVILGLCSCQLKDLMCRRFFLFCILKWEENSNNRGSFALWFYIKHFRWSTWISTSQFWF